MTGRSFLGVGFLGVGMLACLATATADGKGKGARVWSVRDATERDRAVASLRSRGPAGLDQALAQYEALETRKRELEVLRQSVSATALGAHATNGKSSIAFHSDRFERQVAELETEIAAWRDAIDRIGGQRSCTVSRLYWHTDWDNARTAAERTGRPILSLRLLGRLTDEFSCANSRFFRTSLYANREISEYLRDHFVLHWQSVRPVPRVTIDFGDGRKLERTLTGNSAHYVLTADGQPLDVLPGLYSPQSFQAWLLRTHALHAEYVAAPRAERAVVLQSFHAQRRDEVLRQWDRDLERIGGDLAARVLARVAVTVGAEGGKRSRGVPSAAQAATRAVTKTAEVARIMRFANLGGERLAQGMDDELWQAIADLHRADVKLDGTSVELMRAEFPPAAKAGALAETKRRQEDPLLRMVRLFEDSIALDTVRNEYLLHRRVHERFADGVAVTDVEGLNEWVYAQLFLTPSSDPWLGLAPPDVYTALEGGGWSGQQ